MQINAAMTEQPTIPLGVFSNRLLPCCYPTTVPTSKPCVVIVIAAPKENKILISSTSSSGANFVDVKHNNANS